MTSPDTQLNKQIEEWVDYVGHNASNYRKIRTKKALCELVTPKTTEVEGLANLEANRSQRNLNQERKHSA